jgi:hypothetical protein
MRNKIFGGLVMVWGALIVARFFLFPPQGGSAAYQAGTLVGVIFGAVLFGVGLHAFLKKPKQPGPVDRS